MTLPVLFFVLVGAVSLAAAIGVVTSRQPVHSALFLLTHFVTLAVLYVTLDAQFLAATQVIIYAGGIVILILFVIMLIGSDKLPDRSGRAAWVPFTGIVLGLILIFSLVYSLTASSTATTSSISGRRLIQSPGTMAPCASRPGRTVGASSTTRSVSGWAI